MVCKAYGTGQYGVDNSFFTEKNKGMAYETNIRQSSIRILYSINP